MARTHVNTTGHSNAAVAWIFNLRASRTTSTSSGLYPTFICVYPTLAN